MSSPLAVDAARLLPFTFEFTFAHNAGQGLTTTDSVFGD